MSPADSIGPDGPDAVPPPSPGMSLTGRALMAAVGFYRTAISPLRPPSCRYLPTCSEYALDAVRVWGPGRGTWLAVRRLLRCHPWHAGGHDPVPSRPDALHPGGSAVAVPPTRAAA